MTEAIEQITHPLPAARKDDGRNEPRPPAPPTDVPHVPRLEPHKGALVDVMA